MFDFISHFLFLALFWTSCYAISNRIVAGGIAKPGQFPSTVFLAIEPSVLCTGTIISTVYILSAGHCFTPITCSVVAARCHDMNESLNVQPRDIEKFIVHPEYLKNEENTFDLALALLNRPLILNEYVQIIPIAEQTPAISTICTNAGYGSTTLNENEADLDPPKLCYHVVRVVGISKCVMLYSYPDTVCTYSENSTGYSGDSRGPLKCNKKLSAVLSLYIETTDEGNMNLFANIQLASIWIHSNGTKSACSRLDAYSKSELEFLKHFNCFFIAKLLLQLYND